MNLESNILNRKSRGLFNFSMLLPAIIVIAFVMVYPTLYAFFISLTKWELGKSPEFIGLSNYIEMFRMPELVHSIWITFLFSFLVVVLTILLGLYLAILLNMDLYGTKFITALLLIPWAIPPVVNGVMWKWVLDARFGTFNNVLMKLGILSNFTTWQNYNWPALLIIIVTSVYKMVPLATFFFIAAIKTIPDPLYEAAKVDGVSPIGKFFKITLPLVRPTAAILFVLLSVSTFKAFDMIYVLTKGGPANFTSVLNFYSYVITFRQINFGLGSAIAFFLSLVILVISIIYFRTVYKEESYQ